MKYVLLTLISAMLLSVSWPTYGVPFFIFFALVPLLMMEHGVSKFSDYSKKLGRFRTFLPLFCDLECGNNRMALWFKKSGRKPFYDGGCISGIGQFFPVFIGFPMLSLVQKCTGNLLGFRISDCDLDEL